MPSKEQRFSLDWAPDAIIVVGHDGSIVFANNRAEALFGYGHGELLERPAQVLVPEGLPDPGGPAGAMQRFSRSVEGVHRDGTRFAAAIKWRPAPARAGDYLVVSIREEIDREAAAPTEAEPDAPPRAEAALLQQREFFSMFNHDVRQSLQAIQFLCDSLADAPPETVATIGEIVGSVKSLLDTVLRLDEAGTMKPASEVCPLGDVLRRLSRELEPVAQRKGLRLMVDDAPEQLRTDPVLLRELLQNLMANAIRYTETGHVHVRCRSTPTAVRIEVLDTGIGMSSEQLDGIFKGFGRLSGSAQPNEGFGLGLAIVRRIADALDYRVDVESKLGEGSIFIVTAPRLGPRRDPVRVPGSGSAESDASAG